MDAQIKALEQNKNLDPYWASKRQETHWMQVIKLFKLLVKIPCNSGGKLQKTEVQNSSTCQ